MGEITLDDQCELRLEKPLFNPSDKVESMQHIEQAEDHMPDEVELIDFRKALKPYSIGYIPYLKNMIKLDSNDMEWVYTARDYPELLNFFPSHPRPFDSYGTTDVAVVQRSAVRANRGLKRDCWCSLTSTGTLVKMTTQQR
ncbi:g8703 [Coccomyxa viridis]|uniref:G8703 protein n=1 Tax=Coccomyxa viridis TaxID=1274662 RepID=A0ABP1G109_9CHLO